MHLLPGERIVEHTVRRIVTPPRVDDPWHRFRRPRPHHEGVLDAPCVAREG
jgi:hypothetical protein